MELNKWQNHIMDQILLTHDWLKQNPLLLERSRALSFSLYWKTVAGTVVVTPRTVGKTTLCKHFKRKLGERCFLVDGITVHNPNTDGIDYQKTTLVVDEFLFIPSFKLDNLLNHDWREVLLLGSY